MKNNLPTPDQVKSTCSFHHAASARGYVSRKNPVGVVRPYKGRFGDGFVIIKPRWDSTRFVTVEYWIR